MPLRLYSFKAPDARRSVSRWSILAVVVLLAVLVGPMVGLAAEGSDPTTDSPDRAYCTAAARACGTACNNSTDPGSAAAAACEARCAIEHAACDARSALSGVEPWLQDKAEKADRFMEGFDGETGDGETGPPSGQACKSAHERCQTRCEGRHGTDDYARAGCQSVCAMNRATCEAEAGVEAAKPYLEREAERLRGFFDSLLGDDETTPPPPDVPPYPEGNADGTVDL